MMIGTLSSVPIPAGNEQLKKWTEQVARNDGFNSHGDARGRDQGLAIVPGDAGQRSPIQHVIYVVKENRTYDQVFGSLGKGNGDPTLNLFGQESAPNTRTLEREYVTLDNFYADAEVSAQGWDWTVAANSNLYSEEVWPGKYSGRGAPYPSESSDPAIAPNRDPAQAYIWDRLTAAHISFRNYGFYVDANPTAAPGPPTRCSTPTQIMRFVASTRTARTARIASPRARRIVACPGSPSGKRNSTATSRVTTCRPWNWFACPTTTMPAPGLVLPPRAYTADNDWALGQLVDAVSHSKYWASTAIFVTEDDAQDGPDHVDAHRTVADVISPYTRTGRVDSTFYSTASMLRTIELIVGPSPADPIRRLRHPHARRLYKPNVTSYTATKPTQNLQEVNPVNAPFAAQSQVQDLTKEDQINIQQFNEAPGPASREPTHPCPPPDTPCSPPPPMNQPKHQLQPAPPRKTQPPTTATVTDRAHQPRSPDGPPPAHSSSVVR